MECTAELLGRNMTPDLQSKRVFTWEATDYGLGMRNVEEMTWRTRSPVLPPAPRFLRKWLGRVKVKIAEPAYVYGVRVRGPGVDKTVALAIEQSVHPGDTFTFPRGALTLTLSET